MAFDRGDSHGQAEEAEEAEEGRGPRGSDHDGHRRGRLRRVRAGDRLVYYLEKKRNVSFPARCIKEQAISPLGTGGDVEVVGMAPEAECMREMFVAIPWEHKRTLAVPLSQLKVVRGDDQTRQAVEDWYYWVETGYEF